MSFSATKTAPALRGKPPHVHDGEEPAVGAETEDDFLAGLGDPDWQEDDGLYDLPEYADTEDGDELMDEDEAGPVVASDAKPRRKRR